MRAVDPDAAAERHRVERAEDGAAFQAERVVEVVEVDGISPLHVRIGPRVDPRPAEPGELRVLHVHVGRPGEHRVAAGAGRTLGPDHDGPCQVADVGEAVEFPVRVPAALVGELERGGQGQRQAVRGHRLDGHRLGLGDVVRRARPDVGVELAGVGQDDPVAGLPPRHRLRERQRRITGRGFGRQLHERGGQRGAGHPHRPAEDEQAVPVLRRVRGRINRQVVDDVLGRDAGAGQRFQRRPGVVVERRVVQPGRGVRLVPERPQVGDRVKPRAGRQVVDERPPGAVCDLVAVGREPSA